MNGWTQNVYEKWILVLVFNNYSKNIFIVKYLIKTILINSVVDFEYKKILR